ncbi:cell wall integrity and stress response component 3-like [Pyrus communis]|uniref:cell wall integrity and stress response component 3-like n=1 Tax=Pyrus communis TaxID=23211 RepID=UPI0035BF7E9B
MAPLMHLSFRKVLLLSSSLVFFLPTLLLSAHSESGESLHFVASTRKILLELEIDPDQDLPKKTKTSTTTKSSKNQTKLIKPTLSSSKNKTKLIKPTLSSSKNQTKLLKPNMSSSKNQTKILKSTSNSTKNVQLKLLNPTSTPSNSTKPASNSSKKTSDSTKPTSNSSKKTSNSIKPSSPKNQTTKRTTPKQYHNLVDKKKTTDTKRPTQLKPKKQIEPSWIDQEDDTDFVSDFTDLPGKFQQSLIPDLERISTTSKNYLTKANKQMTNQFKPIVGNKYAASIASAMSCAFLLIPLLLVSLLFNRIKAYFSLQKLLIFVQVYLSIYFSILCLSALVTGLEPLKFFYATSQSTYVCLQVLQTLGYVLYLLLLLMYLVLVFSTDSGLGSKVLGLAQIFVGFAVGLHYYMSVFHRAVLKQPPKTNWKVHGIYATCFLVICLFVTAERRKKGYLEEGGEEGKKS